MTCDDPCSLSGKRRQNNGLLTVIMSKKLINTASDVVDEALAGLVAACPGLRLLQGHRVAVRADVDEVITQGKVSL